LVEQKNRDPSADPGMEILTSDLMTETAFDCDQRPGFVVNELPPTTAKKTPQSSGLEDCGVFARQLT
jgi:hypothetical protein